VTEPGTPQIDASRVIEILGQRLAQAEIENAKLEALVQQLVAEKAAEPA
jgi:hypothetical protein